MTRRTTSSAAILFSVFALVGCDFGDAATNAEAREAVDAVVTAEQGAKMSSDAIEITTNFTLGQAAEEAAIELVSWFESQIPCSTASRDGASVTIDFGDLNDACEYNGRTWAGALTVSIAAAEESGAEISHRWDGLTDGNITLDGEASVTWSRDGERRVVHNYEWSGGRDSLIGSGDRTWTLLDAYDGLNIDGDRSWEIDGNIWDLEIQDVEVRGQDPVPQDGAYIITNPVGNRLTLSFSRIDDDSIEVTVDGTRRSRSFIVNSAGDVEENDID
ncbi:MAG: hypothetical protein AAFV53_04625 [Myxococcota bacterium]